jgi:hypothetical protein
MRTRPGLVGVVLLGIAVAVTGCAPGGGLGPLRSESLNDDPIVLDSDYTTLVYHHETGGDTSFVLSDVSARDLVGGAVRNGQVMHIQLLWLPKPGATPMDSTATNASIRHVIISNGEVGVYAGAGFALPSGKPGDRTLKLSVRDASVRLLEATDGFTDPLSPARITGTFTAVNDPREVRRLKNAVSQFVTNAMQETRLVMLSAAQARPERVWARRAERSAKP